MSNTTPSLDEVFALALELSPIDKVRLLERIASTLEQELSEDSAEAEIDVRANFRTAWHEASTGKTHPISDLWDRVSD